MMENDFQYFWTNRPLRGVSDLTFVQNTPAQITEHLCFYCIPINSKTLFVYYKHTFMQRPLLLYILFEFRIVIFIFMDKLDVSNVETKLFSKQPFQVKNVGQNCSNHFFLLNAIRVYLQEIFMN